MAKIAIALRGISYDENYFCIRDQRNFIIDYRKSVENYKEMLIEPFKQYKAHIHFFICTNESKIKEELIKLYQPKASLFLTDEQIKEHKHEYKPVAQRCHDVLNLVKNYSESRGRKYDMIICTRFDLLFNKKIIDCEIDLNKINCGIMCRFSKNYCDNLYILSHKKLDLLIKCFLEVLNGKIPTTHQIWLHYRKNFTTLLKDQRYNVKSNPLYRIIKTRKR